MLIFRENVCSSNEGSQHMFVEMQPGVQNTVFEDNYWGIIFLFLHKNICCDFSLAEMVFNEGSQCNFYGKLTEIILGLSSNFSSYLGHWTKLIYELSRFTSLM